MLMDRLVIFDTVSQYIALFQLYVAASRVGNPDHIKFALREKRQGGEYNWTPNVTGLPPDCVFTLYTE